jgi:hypothetical protein
MTPAGKAEQVRPRKEAHLPPAESEVLHGNQLGCTKRSILASLSICSTLD